MSFRNSQQTRVYFGVLAGAAYARSAEVGSALTVLDTTCLPDRNRVFIPGLGDVGSFSVSGPLDVDGSSDEMFDLAITQHGATTNTPISYMPLGTDGAAWLVHGIETTFGITSGVAATVDYTLSAETNGQHDFNGIVLDDDTVTIDSNGATVDNGAATTNGAVFHLHVTEFSGLTSDDIIVEGSTTGSFSGEETTIATFAQVDALTSERVVVTGSVPRYLRVADDVTGTGSVTRIVLCARR